MTQATIDPPANLPARRPVENIDLRAPVRNPQTLKRLVIKITPQIRDLLPKHLTAEKVLRFAMLAQTRNPKLLLCTGESIVQSIMEAASLGLDFGGLLGEAYLIPYGSECKLMPGYKGYIILARNSGTIKSISAEVVYRNDYLEYEKGTSPVLIHRPNLDEERRDEDIRAAYMVAEFIGGGHHVELLTRQEVEKAKRVSKTWGRDDSPWNLWYPEMSKKTAIRRGFKYLPVSSEKITRALEIDAEHEMTRPLIDVEPRQKSQVLLDGLRAAQNDTGQHVEPDVEMAEQAAQEAHEPQTPEAQPSAAVSSSKDEGAAQEASVGTQNGSAVSDGMSLPDVSGADAEPPNEAEAAQIAADELRQALEQPWTDVEKVLADAGVQGGMTKHAAIAAVKAHVRLVLGKAGKEATIPLDARLRLFEAMRAGKVGADGKIQG
jgi:recombination protein RecT